jgi:uncharacterized protein (DUF302 family)
MIKYGFTKEFEIPFNNVVEIVINELKKEDFGVLTRIDVKDKFKEKLGIEFNKYIILGACNPPSAYEAIMVEEKIGLMLPCNVIIYVKGVKICVSIIKPITMAMGMIDNDDLKSIAERVESK